MSPVADLVQSAANAGKFVVGDGHEQALRSLKYGAYFGDILPSRSPRIHADALRLRGRSFTFTLSIAFTLTILRKGRKRGFASFRGGAFAASSALPRPSSRAPADAPVLDAISATDHPSISLHLGCHWSR